MSQVTAATFGMETVSFSNTYIKHHQSHRISTTDECENNISPYGPQWYSLPKPHHNNIPTRIQKQTDKR